MQEDLKIKAAKAALEYVEANMIIGIGTGSTTNHFIDLLPKVRSCLEGCIPSSRASEQKLRQLNLPILDLNYTNFISLYVDGADEIDFDLQMIKGGGGALTREKIIAAAAEKFICIADQSKLVNRLGNFPIAVEVIPMARSFVGRELLKLGADPVYRQAFVTDNGNIIIDIHNLDLTSKYNYEDLIKLIPGVVENGLFLKRRADLAIIAKNNEILQLKQSKLI